MLKQSMPNSAGRRRTLVKVEIASDAAPNASNEVVPEYLTSFERFAEELLTSGREFQNAMQTVAMLQGILRLPYDSKTAAITSRDRVVIENRILNIAAPPMNEGGANERITLLIVEPE